MVSSSAMSVCRIRSADSWLCRGKVSCTMGPNTMHVCGNRGTCNPPLTRAGMILVFALDDDCRGDQRGVVRAGQDQRGDGGTCNQKVAVIKTSDSRG